MGFFQEFKKFAMRGNVVDMAIGIVIGAAFGKIVSSLVEKIIMPITGFLTGGVNLGDRAATLPVPGLPADMKPPVIGWGAVVQATVDFVIVALAIFLVIKLMNSLRREEAAAPAAPPEEIVLLREIRDALKSGGTSR